MRALDEVGDLRESLYIGDPGEELNTANRLIYVKMYRMPALYAKMVAGRRTESGQYILTLLLPQSQGEAQKTVDVVYARSGVTDSSYAHATWSNAVNDDTIFSSLKDVPGYDAARNNAYLNAYKLAPFASFEDIVKSGNAIPAGSALATKTIQELWPVHEEQGMKVSLFEGEEAGIVRNLVYYTDGTSQTFELDYAGTHQLAASYIMKDSGVLYQPDFWVLGEGAQPGIERIASFIRSKTWNGWLGTLDKRVAVHRSVRDHFDVDMHENAEQVAANLVSNIDSWTATASGVLAWNSVIEKAEEAMPTSAWGSEDIELKMFNLLFLYTYYERFFNFNMGGSEEVGFQSNANAFLVLAFRGSVIRQNCSLVNMTYTVRTSSMLTFASENKLSSTVLRSAAFQPFTGFNGAGPFVDLLVKRTSNFTDTANWFAAYMDTIAYYQEYRPPDVDDGPDVSKMKWRGWDQASRSVFQDQLLLWLTMKPGAQYFASTSMLIATGSAGIYLNNAADMNDTNREWFKKKIDAVFVGASCYASTTAGIVGVDKANQISMLNIDQKSSKLDGGTSWMEREKLWGKKLSVDPYHKDFSDVAGIYNSSGQGAAAMTLNISLEKKRIFFLCYAALNCSWSYYWSHEVAHAIDNDVFLGGDRRGINNTEDYTDGLLTQSHGSLSPVLNLSFDYAKSADILANLTRERISSKEKLDDYYNKLYTTVDVLDYAAQIGRASCRERV